MSDVRTNYDDEIDLFSLIDTLLEEKKRIIGSILIALLIGVALIFFNPNTFNVTTIIKPALNTVFVDYLLLEETLREKGLLKTEENENGYTINSEFIFDMFISEFNDYEELITLLKNDPYVETKIDGLSEKEKRLALIGLAKSFVITVPSKKTENWMISFEWHDAKEGNNLLNQAILAVLINVNKKIKNDIAKISSLIDKRNSREIELLTHKLNSLLNQENERIAIRIQFLLEQSEIAKELEIEKNQLDLKYISINNEVKESSLLTSHLEKSYSLNSENKYKNAQIIENLAPPFYLRGYKAIDKEIEILQNRTEKNRLTLAEDYPNIKNFLTNIENDLTSQHLSQIMAIVEKDNPSDWIVYDLSIAEIKSNKKHIFYIGLSILLGGSFGVMNVLFSNAKRNRKEKLVVV